MIKKILALICLVACGGEAPEGAKVLYTDTQALLAPQRGPGTEFGYQNTPAALNCVLNAPSQNCVVPASKNIKWYVAANTGSSSVDRATVRNRVIQYFSTLQAQGLLVDCADSSKYCITEAGSAQEAGLTLLVEANGAGTGSLCSGGSGDNAEKYTCLFGDAGALTEDSGVVGNYFKRVITTLHVDLGDINARGANVTEDGHGTHNAVFNGMNKALGIGGMSANNSRCASRDVSFTAGCVIQSSEICALNGFTEFNDQTNYGNRSLNCGL